MHVNYFASVLLGKVQKRRTIFFKENRFNDPDCDPSKRAMGMLSEQNKRGLGSSKPELEGGVFGFTKVGH
jgi:hypothetical protein